MKKRVLSILLTVAMTAALVTGCGNTDKGGTPAKDSTEEENDGRTAEEGKDTTQTAGEKNTDSVLKDGNVVDLVMLIPFADQSNHEAVEAAMNEEIQKHVDAKVTFKTIELGNADQANLLLAGGEQADIMMFANTGVIRNMALRGQLLSLDELAPTYAKEALESTAGFEKSCYVNGECYGLTTFRDLASSFGITYRKDWLEESGMKAEDIKTWDDVEVLFEKVKEQHPDAYMAVGNNQSPILNYAEVRFDSIVSGVGCRMDDNDGHIDIVNVYASDDFKEMAERAYEWNQKGYFIPDPATSTVDLNDWMKMGETFAALTGVHPGTPYEMTLATGVEVESIKIEHSSMKGESCAWFQWLIPAQCVAPEKAMAIINLLYSDPDIINLFLYGIEGEDYTFTDKEKGLIALSDSTGWNIGNAVVGNSKIAYVPDFYPEDIYERWDEFNKTADVSPLFGFAFDSTSVKSEVAAVGNVVAKYRTIVGCGLAEPEETMKKINEELEAAGIQKIIDEMQEQVDAWQSSQK